jgi:hypothetical protein
MEMHVGKKAQKLRAVIKWDMREIKFSFMKNK